ncbi:unnamed protein product [Ectocarpus fasciculatus]
MRSSAALRRVRGQLSVATSSPWVWVATGVDPASAIHPPSRKRGSPLRGEYVSPASLNHELPTAGTPEVAFIGRSNQGKSTLVGKLLGNPKLVRASKAPGCTKTVNYFALREGGGAAESPQAFLVDLPGYGFARESKRTVRGWNQAVGSYLEGRSSSVLRRTFVLVDGRHGLQSDDEQMLSFLSSRDVENMVILTKVDKASPAQLVQSLEGAFQLAIHHPATLPVVHCISAHKGQGMAEFENTLYGVSDL